MSKGFMPSDTYNTELNKLEADLIAAEAELNKFGNAS